MRRGRITRQMQEAFEEGLRNPGAPLTPGEQQLLYYQADRARAGPQVVFIDKTPDPINIGEISHKPCADDSDIIDAEIVE